MYKVIIGNKPDESPGNEESFYKNIIKETNYRHEVQEMLDFALKYEKSFMVTGRQGEIDLEGIEELDEGGEE